MIRLLCIIFLLLILVATYRSGSFLDLWLSADQQGALFYAHGEYSKSARAFDTDFAKAIAYYADEDFIAAQQILSGIGSPSAHFYIGNAEAHRGRLDKSLSAYQEALRLQPDFHEAQFNLDYVAALKTLDDKEYVDAGGTGGRLEADKFFFDTEAKNAVGKVSADVMAAQGVSEEVLRQMWMRRVSTTPGDFLASKFFYQTNADNNSDQTDGLPSAGKTQTQGHNSGQRYDQ